MAAQKSASAIVVSIILAALAAAYAGYRLWDFSKTEAPKIEASAIDQLLATDFATVSNQQQKLSTYGGKVLVLNFWATWCPPCRQEMPAFSKVHDSLASQGVQIVGVGIDSPSAIKEFALQYPVSYPLLMGGSTGMDLMRRLGNPNAALPYTLVIGRDGQAAFSHLGVLTEEALATRLKSLL